LQVASVVKESRLEKGGAPWCQWCPVVPVLNAVPVVPVLDVVSLQVASVVKESRLEKGVRRESSGALLCLC